MYPQISIIIYEKISYYIRALSNGDKTISQNYHEITMYKVFPNKHTRIQGQV